MMIHYFRFFTVFTCIDLEGVKTALELHIHNESSYRFSASSSAAVTLPLFMQTLVPLHLGHNYNPLALKRVTYRLGQWPPITAWPLNSWARRLGYSHLGGSVLTQRLLVQLIAICIALLVSQHCLRDISVFSPFFSPSLWVSSSVLFLTFRARGGIRQCLVCD